MQERAAVAGLVLAQLGRVDEEPVGGREQQPHAEGHAGEPVCLQVLHGDGGVGVLRPQILAEFVSQVGGRVPFGVHGRRRLAMDRAMVGREQHRHPAPLGLLERREHR